jgi:hypothetical protein
MKVIGVNILLFLAAMALVGACSGVIYLMLLVIPVKVFAGIFFGFFGFVVLLAIISKVWGFIKWIAIEPYRDYKAKKGA